MKEDWQTYQSLTDEAESLEQKKGSLEQEQQRLEQVLEGGRQEEALEKEARLMLGLKKEGEEVIMVLPPEGLSNNSGVSISTSSDDLTQKTVDSFLSKVFQIWYDIKGFFEKAMRE
jgi:hypothetical protein